MTVLSFGRKLAGGTPQEVRRNPEVIKAYLAAVKLVLEVRDLKVSYGQIEALKGVSIRNRSGRIRRRDRCQWGGKTSLLMALSGAVRTAGGSVMFNGRDVTNLPQHLRVANGIAIVPEGRQAFGR